MNERNEQIGFITSTRAMALKFNTTVILASLLILNLSYILGNAHKDREYDQESSSAISKQNYEDNESKIEKKITIIVGEEGEAVASTVKPTFTRSSKPHHRSLQPLRQHYQSIEARKNESTRIYIDESTKLIYVDEHNETGYLVGEINNNSSEKIKGNHHRHHPTSRTGSTDFFDRFHTNRAPPTTASSFDSNREEGASRTTNYSLFLISRNKDHIAVLLDIEEIDFEPIINCEYQELRFSIVGEISRQLLSKKENDNLNDTDAGDDLSESEINESPEEIGEDSEAGREGSNLHPDAETSAPPLPISEAMAILLNSPLNKTILDDSSETNDFKVIESTIEYLHEETCNEMAHVGHDLEAEGSNPSRQRMHEGGKQQSGNAARSGRRRSKRMKRRRRKPARKVCPENSQEIKDSMSEKLDDYFEWDDFKIICGKTKQFVIPMRSLKLSVYSDEFSPNSKFVIRYQFISDPSLLPAQDNGKYYCRNRNTIDLSLKCNGIDDCGDASDESIKICGYPTGRSSETTSSAAPSSLSAPISSSSSSSSSSANVSHTNGVSHYVNKRRLTYVNGDVLHCCQSNDWLNLIPQSAGSQLNFQSLIGESMNLFSAPLFAPTQARRAHKEKGKRRIKRIVGGGVAPKGAWPGQASLQYELLEPMSHFCAGTLIHPQYVLTAGHCITKDGLNRGIKVVFGGHDLRQLEGNHVQVRYVDDAQIYPGVDVKLLSFDWENDMNNDVALLRLNAPVLITPQVAPACLPPFNTPLAVNTTCRSIGWGQTHGSGNSNLLKHLSLKVVDSSLCSKELFDRDDGEGDKDSLEKRRSSGGSIKRARGKNSRFTSDFESAALDQYSDLTMVCVNNDLGHGICQGDSGGPLYCDRITSTGEHCTEIYAVASFIIQYATVGAMCAVENLPGIFGEVSSKTEWISSTMKMFEQSYRLKYS